MIKFDLKFGIGEKNLEFSNQYKTLIENSCTLLIEVINTDIFKTKVLNYKWHHRRKGEILNFNHTTSSREDVLKKLLSGDDKFVSEYKNDSNELGDNDIDIWIIPYYTKRKIVGSTNPNTYKTWLNINYWNNRIVQNKVNPFLTMVELAENIVHEYCHNIGFGHRGNKPHKHYNRNSVPYAIGDIFNEVAFELKNDKLNIPLSELDSNNEFVIDCSFCTENNIA